MSTRDEALAGLAAAALDYANTAERIARAATSPTDTGAGEGVRLTVQLEGRAMYLSDRGEVKSPGLLREAAQAIADLEQRLAVDRHNYDMLGQQLDRVKAERDTARTSLEKERVDHMSVVRRLNARVEKAEKRIGEVTGWLRIAQDDLAHLVPEKEDRAPLHRLIGNAIAALTPDAGEGK